MMEAEFADGGLGHKEEEDEGVKSKDQDKGAEERTKTSSLTTYGILPIISCGFFHFSYTYTAFNSPLINYLSISSRISCAISGVAYSI